MKKLYLIFLTLLILFIPTTNAVAVYQLDQPVRELNGYTLREVFERPLISYSNPDLDGVSISISGNILIYDGVSTSSGGITYVSDVFQNGSSLYVYSRIIDGSSTNLNDYYLFNGLETVGSTTYNVSNKILINGNNF